LKQVQLLNGIAFPFVVSFVVYLMSFSVSFLARMPHKGSQKLLPFKFSDLRIAAALRMGYIQASRSGSSLRYGSLNAPRSVSPLPRSAQFRHLSAHLLEMANSLYLDSNGGEGHKRVLRRDETL
jgi:hypothetical protein